jgi:hypothetical protein
LLLSTSGVDPHWAGVTGSCGSDDSRFGNCVPVAKFLPSKSFEARDPVLFALDRLAVGPRGVDANVHNPRRRRRLV